jgi:hypothetical protein
MTTPTLAALRSKAEKSAAQAEKDRAELTAAAIAEAVSSDAYGHLSAVAKEAGIDRQVLRELVEKAYPGWLAKAAAARKARKEAAEAAKAKGVAA